MNCLRCGRRLRNKRKDAVFCGPACRVAYNRNASVTAFDPAERIILSLCDYSGSWSKPYRDAGYTVRQIDVALNEADVRLLRWPGKVHGILAAPPCTMFAVAGNRWKRSPDEIREALSVVDACLRLVVTCDPVFWALENPTGKLRQYLGEPAFRFDPCDYGDAYTKRTCLWGTFQKPRHLNRVAPIEVRPGENRIDVWNKQQGRWSRKDRQRLRSLTPAGFARAFFAANP